MYVMIRCTPPLLFQGGQFVFERLKGGLRHHAGRVECRFNAGLRALMLWRRSREGSAVVSLGHELKKDVARLLRDLRSRTNYSGGISRCSFFVATWG